MAKLDESGRDRPKSGRGICESTDKEFLSVLIVDDDETNRIVLAAMLHKDGHRVYTADNGRAAVALYESQRPDLILMDVMMPQMDGYEATRRIKAISGSHFVPVTFLTALTDEASLVRCLDVGGDDFIIKPVSRAILRAKLAAAARMHGICQAFEHQQSDLARHHERLRYEQEVAESIFTKVIGSAGSKAPNIRSEALPFSIATGDLLLAAQSPAGVQHVLLGDYTGHGLAAAMGAIPATETFNAMVRKGFGLRDIVVEMNRKLCATLPHGQFLAACILEWSPRRDFIRVWNGGLPDLIIASGQGKDSARMPSQNLPLGIAVGVESDPVIAVRQIRHGDRIYLYSDGLIEARNSVGEMFGEERLERVITANGDRSRLFDEISAEVAGFRDEQSLDDDITLVEVLCDANLFEGNFVNEDQDTVQSDYRLSLQLGAQALREFDPLRIVECLIKDVNWLECRCAELYTIVAELYSNALEHGVLAMDATLKATPDGFAEYYTRRAKLLSELNAGWICIDIAISGDASAGELILQFEDSGKGFESIAMAAQASDANLLIANGRGLNLVRALCKRLSHGVRGSHVRAVYAW